MGQYRVECSECRWSITFDDDEPAKGMPGHEEWNACSAAMGALESHKQECDHHIEMERLE